MTKTQLFINETGFNQLASEWDILAQSGMTNTPFQKLAYQRAWWQHLAPADLLTIAVYENAGILIGIAPLFIQDGAVHFNGCTDETDYLDIICRQEDAEPVWEAIFDCLCSAGFPVWTNLDLCNIPAASPTHDILPILAEKHGFTFQTNVQEVCPVIKLPASFAEYLAVLPKKQRHETKRKMRRANGADAVLKIVTLEDDVPELVDQFLTLLQKSTFEKNDWLNPARRALFHEVARAALNAGTLQLMFLDVEGQHAAALFNFAYEDRIWVYNSGLDPENFSHLSAGVVLTAKAIEYAIENGYREFDFLRGDEAYKYRFGAVDTKIHNIVISPKNDGVMG